MLGGLDFHPALGNVRPDGQHVPMARLLAMSYRQLIDGLHSRLREDGWVDVRPAFGFVLLAAREESTTSTELAGVLGVTKQATSKLLEAMEAAGYVHRSAGLDDARIRTVDLTERGHLLLAAVEQIYADLEREWAVVIGERAVEQTRRHLSRVLLAANSGKFPVVRATP